MSDSNAPDGETVLKEMVKHAEHIQQSEWPAGEDLTNLRRASSPNNIKVVAAYVSTLKSERDAAQARVKVLAEALEFYAIEWLNNSDPVAFAEMRPRMCLLDDQGKRAREALKENGQ